MVKKLNQKGSALAIVLFVLIIMLLLAVTLNQIMIGQLRAVNNSGDVFVAQNYARLALLDAESTVYNFDVAKGLESMSVTERNTAVTNAMPASGTCNANGWCYKSIAIGALRNSDPAWQPWVLSENAGASLFPCSSYTVSKNGSNNAIPLMDEKSSMLTAANLYNTGDSFLCSQPRYIMEVLQLDFRGYIPSGHVAGAIEQNNGRFMISFIDNGSITTRSARLYRVTVRAFGKNGDTRALLQEVLAVAESSNSRSITGDDTTANIPAHNIMVISTRWLN